MSDDGSAMSDDGDDAPKLGVEIGEGGARTPRRLVL